jgi:CysZ protein
MKAIGLIFKDPVNVALAIIPGLLSLVVYFSLMIYGIRNADYFGIMIRRNTGLAADARWLDYGLTIVFVFFIFLLMNWTFVLLVGILSGPFNSIISGRIEKKLRGVVVETQKSAVTHEVTKNYFQLIKNELKKIIFLILFAMLAFFINLIPVLYPVGVIILACVLAAQFLDYSWSRHNLTFAACLKDYSLNFFPYSFYGLGFLILVTIPLVNVFVPSLATAHFTEMWVKRNMK